MKVREPIPRCDGGLAGERIAGVSDKHDYVARELAPHGRLRAAINLGNPVLAQPGVDGPPTGVSVDLARELAIRLRLPLELVVFDAAGKVTASASTDAWDIAFLAIDGARAQAIHFSPPYVVIEGGYLVRSASVYREVGDVDHAGTRIAVAKGSAYHLFLSRSIRSAELVQFESGAEAFAAFERDRLDVLAGVKAPLARYAETGALRVLPGSFMEIRQAMAIPRGRSGAEAWLRQFVEARKADGFVARALDRSGQRDARVAPPA
jgi:polar amino acid transport system substrate-binding protein